MESDFEDDSSHWELHPLTKRVLRHLRRRAELAMHELQGRCAVSTDPLVAMAWGRYSAIQDQVRFYENRTVRNTALRELEP